MDFVAIDVEIANADMSSICQIGVARVVGRDLTDSWKTYVDPEDEFDPVNTSIHGISQETVRGAPTIPAIQDELLRHLSGAVLVCHTHCDRVALQRSFSRYHLPMPDWTWLDSARVARRAWEQFASRGYGLQNLCDYLGYRFSHHDALEDAQAAAHVLLAAMDKTGIDLDGWLARVRRPISVTALDDTVARSGNPDGAFYGEVMVFTGALTIPRREAADMAAQIGCDVAETVTKKTTMLVVGDQDTRKLSGHAKSSKHRKAEALIFSGQPIRILCESDFAELARITSQEE